MTLPGHWIEAAARGLRLHQDLPSLGGNGLHDLMDQLDGHRPESRLLLAVASLRLQQQIGFQPRQAAPPPVDVAPPDARPPCSRRAMRHLFGLLRGHYDEALPEWLAEVARTGQRVSEEGLPALLDAATQDVTLRPLVRGVVGQRGLWLARVAQHTDSAWPWLAACEPAPPVSVDRQREQALIDRLRLGTKGIHATHPARQQLNELPPPWSEQLAVAVLNSIERYFQQRGSRDDVGLLPVLYRFALCAPPSTLGQFQRVTRSRKKQPQRLWTEAIASQLALLRFREQMLDAIYKRR